MKLVNNYEGFKKLYPYKNSGPRHYPKKYPCLVSFEEVDGGLMGSAYELKIVHIPAGVDVDSFVKGVNAPVRSLGIQ